VQCNISAGCWRPCRATCFGFDSNIRRASAFSHTSQIEEATIEPEFDAEFGYLGGTIFWLCPRTSCPRGIQIDAALRFFELRALVAQQIVPGASCGSQEDLSGGDSDAGRRAIKRQYESRLRGADDER